MHCTNTAMYEDAGDVPLFEISLMIAELSPRFGIESIHLLDEILDKALHMHLYVPMDV